MEQPVRLTPSLRERVWGRTRLAPWYPDSRLLPDEGEQAAVVAHGPSRFLRTWAPG